MLTHLSVLCSVCFLEQQDLQCRRRPSTYRRNLSLHHLLADLLTGLFLQEKATHHHPGMRGRNLSFWGSTLARIHAFCNIHHRTLREQCSKSWLAILSPIVSQVSTIGYSVPVPSHAGRLMSPDRIKRPLLSGGRSHTEDCQISLSAL